MARNTKSPAADAASTSSPAAQADARAARDAKASAAADPVAKDTPSTPSPKIEDAVVVSEESAPGAPDPGKPEEPSTGDRTPPPGAPDASTALPETGAPDEPVSKTSPEKPKVSEQTSRTPTSGKTRTTIGTGTDGAEPDQRLGKGEVGKGESGNAAPERKVETSSVRSPAPSGSATSGRRGSAFWPLVLGGLVAGAIGYAIPTFLMPRQGPQIDAARVESLEAGLAALTDQRANDARQTASLRAEQATESDALDALEARVAALESSSVASSEDATPAGPTAAASTAAVEGSDPASVADLTALSRRVDDVTARVSTLEDGVDGLTGQVSDLSGRTDTLGSDVETVKGEVDAASGRIDTLDGDVAALRDDLGGRIDAVETGLETATERASSVEDNAAALAREAARNQIRAALQSGVPYDEALGVLDGDAPAALSDPAAVGIATQAGLVADFPALSREALRQARAAEPETGVGSLFRNAFGARSLEPRAGDDPDAVLSRAEAAVRGGDLEAAIGEIDALPGVARDVLADWTRRARARVAARAAADEFLKDG